MRLIIVLLAGLLSAASLRAQENSNAAAWQTDIAFLQKELVKRHPNPYFAYPQKSFEADLAKLSANLNGKTDLEIGLELQTVVSKLQDAQTRVDLTPLLQQNKVIPIGLGWYSDGLYMSATIKRFAPALGRRILEINGLPTELALERLGRYFGKENQEAIRKDGPQWLRFPEALKQAGISKDDTLAMVFADEQGQRYLIKTYPVDFQKDKTGLQPAQFVPKAPDFRWDPMKQIYSLRWLESDSIVYVQSNACFSREMSLAEGDSTLAFQMPPFQPIVDSLAALMDHHPGARLFFDLRFNSTGNNPADGIALAERLAAMPFVNLPGRMYVAVNRYTTVTAVEIATAFKNKTRALLIGEPPANRPDHWGDPKSMILPNSELLVYYGSRRTAGLRGNSNALPLDIPIELPFSAFRDGKDPVLDYVRQLRTGSK